MTQDLERPTREGTKRERFLADARAQSRWRRHETAGRLSAIRNDIQKLTREADQLLKIAVKALLKEPKTIDAKEILHELPGKRKRGRPKKIQPSPSGEAQPPVASSPEGSMLPEEERKGE